MEIILNPKPQYDITDQGKRNTRQYKKFLEYTAAENEMYGILQQTILAFEDAETLQDEKDIIRWLKRNVVPKSQFPRTRMTTYVAYCKNIVKRGPYA